MITRLAARNLNNLPNLADAICKLSCKMLVQLATRLRVCVGQGLVLSLATEHMSVQLGKNFTVPYDERTAQCTNIKCQ